jgi:GrpB-like predicted nucleotidyltransferase (UPF0157 family)
MIPTKNCIERCMIAMMLKDQILIPVESTATAAPVEITDYDEYWPSTFRREKIRLLAGIGSWVQGIEHIGSTSVPGMAARPIIDMVAAVRLLADADTFCAVALQKLGYRYDPTFEKLLPDWRVFVRGSQMSRRCIQLFVVEKQSALWREFLALRALLRGDPAAAAAFGNHKRNLAASTTDRDRYQREKITYLTRLLQLSNNGEMLQPAASSASGFGVKR